MAPVDVSELARMAGEYAGRAAELYLRYPRGWDNAPLAPEGFHLTQSTCVWGAFEARVRAARGES